MGRYGWQGEWGAGPASARRAHERRWRIDPLALPAWLIISVAAVPLLLLVVLTEFSFTDPALLGLVLPLTALALFGWLLQRRGFRRLGLFCEAVAALNSLGVVVALLSAVFAATDLPYVDVDLAALDQAIFGFRWLEAVAFVRDMPTLLNLLSASYLTLFWQPVLLVAVLLVARHEQRTFVFVTAWAVCLTASVSIFPFAPALGGYLHYGITETSMPDVLVASAWQHVDVLGPIRTGALRELGPDTLEGIITFPSFHAAGAVMLAWGFWGTRLRWPMLGLNAVMLPSSIFIGGHYLVDVVAGSLLAVASIVVARRLVVGAAPVLSHGLGEGVVAAE
jgi:hypothetical protein